MDTLRRIEGSLNRHSGALALMAIFLAVGGSAFAVAKLGKDTVGSKQIKANAVKESEVAANSVGASEVVDGTIGAAEVADGAIGSGEIGDGAVGSGEIGDGAVGSGEIATGAIGSGKIGNAAVGFNEIADDAVGPSEILDGAIGTGEIAGGAVGAGQIANGAVGTTQIGDGQVGPADLAPDEAFHVVGTAGEPAFGTGGDNDCVWSDFATATMAQPVAFYKSHGRVHLAGVATGANGAGGDAACDNNAAGELIEDYRIFTLPPAYRPALPVILLANNGATNQYIVAGGVSEVSGVPPGVVGYLGAAPVPPSRRRSRASASAPRAPKP